MKFFLIHTQAYEPDIRGPLRFWLNWLNDCPITSVARWLVETVDFFFLLASSLQSVLPETNLFKNTTIVISQNQSDEIPHKGPRIKLNYIARRASKNKLQRLN